MIRLPRMQGDVSPLAYALAAPLLILSQHALVELIHRSHRQPLFHDAEYWLLPLGRLAVLPGLSPLEAALAFAFGLFVAWAVAVLSFRRATRARRGHLLAAASVIPVIQIAIILLLALMPAGAETDGPEQSESTATAHTVQGILAGVAIIVLAVLVSALTFGAYGWGLFVLTPFTVGVTTGYLVNREADLGLGRTVSLVMTASALGSLALVMFALEGLACLVLAAPLAAGVAVIGGSIGHAVAVARHSPAKPFLAIAFLPAAFALEAAMPPSVMIETHDSIEIAAQPAAVWRALISDEPIVSSPGMVGRAGLAFPIRGRILGAGTGALRVGEFSTGAALERITAWAPERRLAFEVLSQPAAMGEMSPYRRVHAPHVHGYFETAETRFELERLPGNRTRLTIRSSHLLHIDPAPYWQPIASWAASENAGRVLEDIREKAERSD